MTTIPKSVVILALAGTAIGSAGTTRADAIFSDTEFADADWQATVLSSDGDTSHAEAHSPTGGNPDAFRRMSYTFNSPGSLFVFHEYLPGVYDPATQGAIASLDYHEDIQLINPPFAGAQELTAPALLQDGIVYVGPGRSVTNTSWVSVELPGLTASDFAASGGSPPGNPDFTSGSPIRFGYRRANSTGFEQLVVEHGIDNWSFTVDIVPEPSTLALLGMGVLGLLACPGRRRR